jgi:hypothetical protein
VLAVESIGSLRAAGVQKREREETYSSLGSPSPFANLAYSKVKKNNPVPPFSACGKRGNSSDHGDTTKTSIADAFDNM